MGIVEEALGLRRGTRGEDDDAARLRRARASGAASGGVGELPIAAAQHAPASESKLMERCSVVGGGDQGAG